MTESITTAAPIVPIATKVSDSDADITYLLAKENWIVTLVGTTYYSLDEEDRIWRLT